MSIRHPIEDESECNSTTNISAEMSKAKRHTEIHHGQNENFGLDVQTETHAQARN